MDTNQYVNNFDEKLRAMAKSICLHVIEIEREPEQSFDNMEERREKQIQKVIDLLRRNY